MSNDEHDKNNFLDQIGDDPWVQGSWEFTVTWFIIRLIAVIVMFIYVVVS